MKIQKMIVSLLLISSAFAAPASANYFHNTALSSRNDRHKGGGTLF